MAKGKEDVILYNNQAFENCTCKQEDKVEYTIKHNFRPLQLPRKMVLTIEMLLWYSPNNPSSKQAFENNYLKMPIFEDAIMTYYLRYLEIKSEDICFVSEKSICHDLVSPYVNAACRKCHKIIVTKRQGETKITCILRHLRNCVAHGNFNLLSDEEFIGFDEIKGNYTAVFKINISRVYEFCEQLIHYPDFTISHIFQYILLKYGYSLISFVTGAYNYRDADNMEELIFAINGFHALRINCSRYSMYSSLDSVELIEEYTISYDEQFCEDVSYIDLFYCEAEPECIKKIYHDKYVISFNGLVKLFEGNIEILNNIWETNLCNCVKL